MFTDERTTHLLLGFLYVPFREKIMAYEGVIQYLNYHDVTAPSPKTMWASKKIFYKTFGWWQITALCLPDTMPPSFFNLPTSHGDRKSHITTLTNNYNHVINENPSWASALPDRHKAWQTWQHNTSSWCRRTNIGLINHDTRTYIQFGQESNWVGWVSVLCLTKVSLPQS